jgi:hypothetical protein
MLDSHLFIEIFQDIKDFSEEINSLNKEKPKKKKSKK